ncbi:MAG: dihydroneopterin triphosphate diphosphatase [Gammaproteobacteria bacterium]|nr:dihydroneopterin triphosphate diphosphatase [Gammaproteobacteria bacterium]
MPEFRRPESILVIVYTDDLQVLLLKRVAPFEFWQSVTGSLQAGESPAAAAERELLEETGLSADGRLIETGISRTFTIDPRWRDRFAPGITENLEHEFHYRLPMPVDIVINSEEHSEYQWVPDDQATELVWSWTNREALERLRIELV